MAEIPQNTGFSLTPSRDDLVYRVPIQWFGDVTAQGVHEFIQGLAAGFVQAFELFEATPAHLCRLLDGLANLTDLLEFIDDHADRSTLELEFASAYPTAGMTTLEDSGDSESQVTTNEAAQTNLNSTNDLQDESPRLPTNAAAASSGLTVYDREIIELAIRQLDGFPKRHLNLIYSEEKEGRSFIPAMAFPFRFVCPEMQSGSGGIGLFIGLFR